MNSPPHHAQRPGPQRSLRLRRLLSIVVALCALAVAPPGHARCQMGNVATIPVASNGNQLLTHGLIDGRPVSVLIDTGASTSFIWRPAVERLGLRVFTGPRMRMFGLGGETRVDAAFVDQLQIDAFTAKDLKIPVAGDVPSGIDFVFGEDYLSRDSVEFDVRHGAVRTMETSGCTVAELPYWAKTFSMADLLASPRDAQAIRVNVLLNGHVVRAQIDSGSDITLVAKSVADSVGLRYANSSAALVGIGHRSLHIWIAEVQSLKLGDESIGNTQLRVAQLEKYETKQRIGSRIDVPTGTAPSMLLGMDFLRSHRVLIDNTTRKMVFTYEGGPVFETVKPAESNEASSNTAGFGTARN